MQQDNSSLKPKTNPKKTLKSFIKKAWHNNRAKSPSASFHSDHYLRHNARRLEHLASLRLAVSGQTVLELGSGIGDHSHYYIDRECPITITDARSDNIEFLKERYPLNNVQILDLEHPPSTLENSPFDIIHCYGLLYHLGNPEQALAFMSTHNRQILLIETCVSFGENEEINLLAEEKKDITQSFSGTGCRPTRLWIYKELKKLYQYVYLPKTQPNHKEFPLDWKKPEQHQSNFSRAIFIASRKKIDNEILVPDLIDLQYRHP